MDTSRVHFHGATMGTPKVALFVLTTRQLQETRVCFACSRGALLSMSSPLCPIDLSSLALGARPA